MHPAIIHFGLAVALLALGALLAVGTRLPALPLYLLFGVLTANWLDIEQLQPLPDLGLLLLLFSIGLEFGPERLVALSGRAGLWDALALPTGWLLGLALGLDWRAALLLGGVVYISSSAVIARLIIDLNRAAYPESEVVLGVLVCEDMVIAAVLALTAGQTGAAALLASLVLVAGYLLTAHLLGPRLHHRLERLPSEPLLLLGAAFTVGTAELFHAVGASEGIGAFLAGTIVASIGMRERMDTLFGLLTMLYLIPRGEFTLVLGAIALQDGSTLVSQTAVLMVLLSVPLGALAIQVGPQLTRTIQGRRSAPAAPFRPQHSEQESAPVVRHE
jgi:CPA2 family monovalent cation:H+ antiporter-2